MISLQKPLIFIAFRPVQPSSEDSVYTSWLASIKVTVSFLFEKTNDIGMHILALMSKHCKDSNMSIWLKLIPHNI